MSNNSHTPKRLDRSCERGMTLIEMAVAMVILTIGIVAVATTVTFALQNNTFSRNTTQGKMLMLEMIEQIETLRNTGQLTFDQIANTGEVINPSLPATQFSGFPTDFQPIRESPGADGIFGTIDEQIPSIPIAEATSQYVRKVTITLLPVNPGLPNSPINPNIKKIDVTIRYPGFNGTFQTLTTTSYISNQRN